MDIHELLKGEKCKQNLRLEVKILDTPLSSKTTSVTRQENRWCRSTKDSLSSSTVMMLSSSPTVMMLMPRKHLSPGRGRSSFPIQQKMELKQKECEMRKPASNNRQAELDLYTDFLGVRPVPSSRKYSLLGVFPRLN